jgi:hypothetical protein
MWRGAMPGQDRVRRLLIESQLQNMVGPISNIGEFKTPELFAMRDRLMGNQRREQAADYLRRNPKDA